MRLPRSALREDIRVALLTYLFPLRRSRVLERVLLLAGLAVLFALGTTLSRTHDISVRDLLGALGRFCVVPGVPIAAIILSELPLRDGLRHRTLLYPLLGPASRPVVVLVRTLATAGVVGTVLGLLAAGCGVLSGSPVTALGPPVLGVMLAALAYSGLCGLVQLRTDHGTVTCLVAYLLADEPLASLPFEICRLSPAYHLRVLAGQGTGLKLPIDLPPPEPSVAGSALVLFAIGSLAIAITTWRFSRRSLSELC